MTRSFAKPQFTYPALGNMSDWNLCGHIADQSPSVFRKD